MFKEHSNQKISNMFPKKKLKPGVNILIGELVKFILHVTSFLDMELANWITEKQMDQVLLLKILLPKNYLNRVTKKEKLGTASLALSRLVMKNAELILVVYFLVFFQKSIHYLASKKQK